MNAKWSEVLRVHPARLSGSVHVSGSKCGATGALAASLLTDEDVVLENFPRGLLDVSLLAEMLEALGKSLTYEEDRVTIRERRSLTGTLSWQRRSVRQTLLLLPALVARLGYGSVPMPGGCRLGHRKHDMHLAALKLLGAETRECGNHISARRRRRLKGQRIRLRLPSTGVSQGALLAASVAEGRTTLINAHLRPEVVDLVSMLNRMGAQIRIRDGGVVEVTGVDKLGGVTHRLEPDYIEAMSWVLAALATRGDVTIHGFNQEHLALPLAALDLPGVVEVSAQTARVRGLEPRAFDIATAEYPGINSDLQPLYAAMATQAKGLSSIVEYRFRSRFQYMGEMRRMGCDTVRVNNRACIVGPQPLRGSDVVATDIRSGMALCVLAFCAAGPTHIRDAWQLERGYERVVDKLRNLGARVDRVSAVEI